MKILIDHQSFSMQNYGGVSRIFAELYSYIKNESSHKVIVPILAHNNLIFNAKNNQFSLFSLIKNQRIKKIINELLKRINSFYTLLVVPFLDYDFFISTYYSTYFQKVNTKKTVLFVYDMIHEIYPHLFQKDKTIQLKKKSILSADIIFAISENTKQDLIKFYPELNPNKIYVTYLSHSLNNNQISNRLYSRKYILFTGTRNGYKNFEILLQAFNILSFKNPNVDLVCIGGGKFSNLEKNIINSLGLESRIIQREAKENELYSYYKNAEVFVFPSLYEGFGIPVLEAMYSECPVVLGSVSSFPEIAGEAGLYCDITSALDISLKIQQVLDDEILRKKLINDGINQVRKFSWQNFSIQIIQALEKNH